MNDASVQLDGFLAKYPANIQAQGVEVLERMRARFPNAIEMVYDNYNALVCGFGPTERTSGAIFSIAFYPRHINLFFLQGVNIPDPHGLLQGQGSRVRSIRLDSPQDLDRREVIETMELAIDCARVPFDPEQPYRLVIKSISAKQRPRTVAK